MKEIMLCSKCRSENVNYLGKERVYCNNCKQVHSTAYEWYLTPYERQKNAVYATGNKWAIENWENTH